MFSRNAKPTTVQILIGINVLVFIFVQMLPPDRAAAFDALFGLSGRGLGAGRLWQLVTYQFVHANFIHLLVNMVGLWFAGNILERVLGGKPLVLLYLLSGVAGGVLQMLWSSGPVLVGASGAVSGLVAAFSTLYPRMPITALVFFVIPVRMQVMWLGIMVAGLSLLFLVTGLFSDIGNAAHLGGALGGFAWVRHRQRHFRVVR